MVSVANPLTRSLLDRAHLLIDYHGPVTVLQLAELLGVWPDTAETVLSHPSFRRYPRPANWGPPLYTIAEKVKRGSAS